MLWEKRKEKEEDVGIAVERDTCRHSVPPRKDKERGQKVIGREEEKDGVARHPIKERLE